MYLSRIVFDPTNRKTWECVCNCQYMHRLIMRAFPLTDVETPRAHFKVLYRLELNPDGVLSYVQSETKPDWSYLVEEKLISSSAPYLNPACKSIDGMLDNLTEGMILRFRLKANVTKKVGSTLKSERLAGKKSNGTRVPIRSTEEQIAWLRRKGIQGGFLLLSVSTDSDVANVSIQPNRIVTGQKGQHLLTFQGVTYDGYLQITDSSQFRNTLTTGIGSGKSYGFGLMTVAPAD